MSCRDSDFREVGDPELEGKPAAGADAPNATMPIRVVLLPCVRGWQTRAGVVNGNPVVVSRHLPEVPQVPECVPVALVNEPGVGNRGGRYVVRDAVPKCAFCPVCGGRHIVATCGQGEYPVAWQYRAQTMEDIAAVGKKQQTVVSSLFEGVFEVKMLFEVTQGQKSTQLGIPGIGGNQDDACGCRIQLQLRADNGMKPGLGNCPVKFNGSVESVDICQRERGISASRGGFCPVRR